MHNNSWLAFFTFKHLSICYVRFLARISLFQEFLVFCSLILGSHFSKSRFSASFKQIFSTKLYQFHQLCVPHPKPPSSQGGPLRLLGRGGGGLVEVFISSGNKHQIQANHIKTHRKNLYFVLKAIPGLNYKFTE